MRKRRDGKRKKREAELDKAFSSLVTLGMDEGFSSHVIPPSPRLSMVVDWESLPRSLDPFSKLTKMTIKLDILREL